MKIKDTENPDYLQGTNNNDKIFAKGGDDTIIGSGGSDAIDGGLDLQNLGVSVTATFGSKYIIDVETVIAPNNQVNTIDASRIGGVVIDLEAGYSRGSYRFERSTNFQNFDNAIGTGLNDTPIGNYKNNSF
jgi:RTX calcium-binding nonapeptide repeat (4 copies)